MHSVILIKLKSAIFIRNLIFDPVLMIKFFSSIKFAQTRNVFFGGVQEPKIFILDPGLDYKGLR
jgi:hypothetical protein